MQKERKKQSLLVSLTLHPIKEVGTTVKLNVQCSGKTYQVNASSKSNLLAIVKDIELDAKFRKVLEILEHDKNGEQPVQSRKGIDIEEELSVPEALDLIQSAAHYFDRKLEINITDLSMKYFVVDEKKANELNSTKDMDLLPFPIILKIYKAGYDLLSNQMRHRVSRFLKKYLNQTERPRREKAILSELHRAMKNIKEEPEQEQGNMEFNVKATERTQVGDGASPIKSQKRVEKGANQEKPKKQSRNVPDPNKVSNKSKENDEQVENDNEKPERRSKEKKSANGNAKYKKYQNKKDGMRWSGNRDYKPKVDDRIILGIKGDTNAGWRERIRTKKVPNEEYIEVKNEDRKVRHPKKTHNTSAEKKDVPPEEKVVRVQEFKKKEQSKSSDSAELRKIYSFPQDKKTFIFEQNRTYKLLVNDLFWISIQPAKHVITIILSKENKGFVRPGKIELVDNGKGFMTDGLTFGFDSVCNFQDGGTTFGGATVLDFIPNGKQWFSLKTVDIFTKD